MKIKGKTVLVCDCEGTMPLDGSRLETACGSDCKVASQLCGSDLGRYRSALEAGGPVLVACTQEAPLFGHEREDRAPDLPVTFVNIRERAGWSTELDQVYPKIAALLAEGALDLPPVPSLTLSSEGVALIYGRDERAIELAAQLKDRLDVTVLLTRPEGPLPPAVREFPIVKGTIARASGHLGAFEIEVNDYAAAIPSSRRALIFAPPRNGAKSKCDIIIDVTGGPALFSAHGRDGYLRADPGSPAELKRVALEAEDLVGEFDKPFYVDYRPEICAHSRSRKTGCTRCLEVCPTGAISPAGDHVKIDPYICMGCGQCSSVCPTGAATYAMPKPDALLGRLRALLLGYHGAGGQGAVLLVHDRAHGDKLIDALARYGDGLPARAIPFGVNEITQLGLEFFAAAFAYGAVEVRLLLTGRRRDDLAGLAAQLGVTETVLTGLGFGSGRIGLIETDDPDELSARLRGGQERDGGQPSAFLPLGDKRSLTKFALRELQAAAPEPVPILPLAPGAPFGQVVVDVAGCTLCLSCVPACPTGALQDNPDSPMLSFIEDACVQCGICKNTCPEQVISLNPRLNFLPEASRAILIKQDEPCHCISCGKAFGTKATVDRIIEKLAGKHWMFGRNDLVERMRMCGDCRIVAQTRSELDPYAGPPRPAVRTTDDYLAARAADDAAE